MEAITEQNYSLLDLPDNALLQVMGDGCLKGHLYSLLLTSKKINAAVAPRCEVEKLLLWIQASLSRGKPEEFEIGRAVLKAWENRCIKYLDDRYKEGRPLVLDLLERRIKKLENLFRDFLCFCNNEKKGSVEKEKDLPIPFDLKIPTLLEKILASSCLSFMSKGYIPRQGTIKRISKNVHER